MISPIGARREESIPATTTSTAARTTRAKVRRWRRRSLRRRSRISGRWGMSLCLKGDGCDFPTKVLLCPPFGFRLWQSPAGRSLIARAAWRAEELVRGPAPAWGACRVLREAGRGRGRYNAVSGKEGGAMEFFLQFLSLPILILGLFVVSFLASAVKIVQEYERGVIFRLGRLQGPKGPGLFFIIPIIDRMVKVDLRVVTLDVPSQEAITRDNVTVKVNAVVFFRVVDPSSAIVQVEDFRRATWNISQTTLRNVLGQSLLDDLLANREQVNQTLQHIIDEQTEPWGVKVSIVEVKDVELPQSMQRAMARQAEAEREKRAKVIHAEGELEASQQLAQAAVIIDQNPLGIQLRYLQTLTEIGAEKNTTVVFPLPIDLIAGLFSRRNGAEPAPTASTSDDVALG